MDVGDVDERTEETLAHRFAAAFLVTATTARRELGSKRRHLDFRELTMLTQKHGLLVPEHLPSRRVTLVPEA